MRTKNSVSPPSSGGGRSSPFFAPKSPKPQVLITPNGSRHVRDVDAEVKSTVSGAAFNLINAIVGAGIVGIPFALRECGLIYGVAMVIVCAIICVKSLRLLIELAKHVDVPSYERLMEASFGRTGFIFISINMLIFAYGAMVGYLIVIKSTLPNLLGVAPDNAQMKRAILTIASLSVILPISLQRDIKSLAKTSIISVIFDIIIVIIIVTYSPISVSVEKYGGIGTVLTQSKFESNTFFLGLGILSFAFVCQHSAFIIAGSIERPTRTKWNRVTGNAAVVCGALALIMGVFGFLGFMEATEGNILINLDTYAMSVRDESVGLASNIAQGLLCTTMCFVYPIESFVARHVCVALFFKGRRAHEGDDHSVLARTDRRVAITLALYLMALVPALLFDDLGNVFAMTGAVAGSSLSYIGPGLSYLAVHGSEFLVMASKRWGFVSEVYHIDRGIMGEQVGKKSCATGDGNSIGAVIGVDGVTVPSTPKKGCIAHCFDTIAWYLSLMPIWCAIAQHGQYWLRKHEETEAEKSPHPYRLGKVTHRKPHLRDKIRTGWEQVRDEEQEVDGDNDEVSTPRGKQSVIPADSLPIRAMLPLSNSCPMMYIEPQNQTIQDAPPQDRTAPIKSSMKQMRTANNKEEGHTSYGTSNVAAVNSREEGVDNSIHLPEQHIKSTFIGAADGEHRPLLQYNTSLLDNNAKAAAMSRKPRFVQRKKTEQKEVEDDPQDGTPSIFDFIFAVFLVLFGVVAAVAGLYAVFHS